MTDALDPDHLLASAALDAEVTPDERVRAESSDTVRAAMDAYRAIRTDLRSVEIPVAGRESAITTALAVFDELSGDRTNLLSSHPSSNPPSNLVSLNTRRQRQYGWLTGVAAAAVVAVLGIAMLSSRSGEDQKSAATSAQATATAAKASANAETPLAADTAASMAGPTAAAGGGATNDPVGNTALGDPWAGAPSLNTDDELRRFSASLSAAAPVPSADTTLVTRPVTTPVTTPVTMAMAEASQSYAVCLPPVDGTITPVIYRGRRAYLVRDTTAVELRVLDASTCSLVVTIPFG